MFRSAVAAILIFSAPLLACPFCTTQGLTFAGELAQADMIVVGTVLSSSRDDRDLSKSKTELRIDTLIKSHAAFPKPKTLTIPRYIPMEKGGGPQLLLFCYVNSDSTDAAISSVVSTAVFAQYRNASIDAYRGDELKANSQLPKYLEQTQKLQGADAQVRLKFYFDYLEANEVFISSDAYMEFGNADYKDVQKLASKLPAETLLKWLKDPNTAPSRHGLYGMLLGHCGKAEHAAVIRKLLDDPDNAFSLGLDGMLAGYMMLDAEGGADLLGKIVANPKKDFTTRYAALRTLRFVHDFRPDLLKPQKLLGFLKTICEQDDISDMGIEDLRKWKQWEQADFVLELAKRENLNASIIKRAILRYAIQAGGSGHKDSAAYVEKVRLEKPKLLKDVEELLKEETPKVKGK